MRLVQVHRGRLLLNMTCPCVQRASGQVSSGTRTSLCARVSSSSRHPHPQGAPPDLPGRRVGPICTQGPARGRRVARAAQQPSPERAARPQHDPVTPSLAPVRPRLGTTCRWQSAVSVVRAQPVPRSAGARLPRSGKPSRVFLRYCTGRHRGSLTEPGLRATFHAHPPHEKNGPHLVAPRVRDQAGPHTTNPCSFPQEARG